MSIWGGLVGLGWKKLFEKMVFGISFMVVGCLVCSLLPGWLVVVAWFAWFAWFAELPGWLAGWLVGWLVDNKEQQKAYQTTYHIITFIFFSLLGGGRQVASHQRVWWFQLFRR